MVQIKIERNSENDKNSERSERNINMVKNKKIISIFCLLISLFMVISISAAECVYVGGMPFGVRFEAGEVMIINTNQIGRAHV